MKYLTKDEILDLHAYAVTRYGGRMGVASQDRLMSAIDAPRQVMFGAELYPDLPSKAAALAFLLLVVEGSFQTKVWHSLSEQEFDRQVIYRTRLFLNGARSFSLPA